MQLNCNPGFEASKKEKTIVSQREPVLWMWLLGTLEVASGLDLNKKKIGNARELPAKPPTFQLALECWTWTPLDRENG